jgi:alpha-L-fucosidase 2
MAERHVRSSHNRLFLAYLCILLAASTVGRADDEIADPLDRYNVAWDSPSKDHNGSMPIGNGEIGANVWVEPGGDLVLLLSKTDAWSENCRLLKLGRIRLRLSPNPLADGAPFKQTLRLRQGEILIEMGKDEKAATLRVWIDANRPVVLVEAGSPSPFDVQATLEVWRTKKRQLAGKEVNSAYGLHGAPFPTYVYPDTVVDGRQNQIVWYHRNETSLYENNLKHQGMEGFLAKSPDPLLHRTFGSCIEGDGLVSENPMTLGSTRPQKRFVLSIYPLCSQTDTITAWLKQLDENVAGHNPKNLDEDRTAHCAWWNDFWNRSWIRVTGPPETETVTRGYTLQRWINAGAGRGVHPIKFNGTIFTVDGGGFDADYRQWGGPYWWQNTRLPYWPMLACGDFDMMVPMFRMYQDMLPLAEFRTKTWFHHEGAFIGETIYFWGMYNNTNYGWNRGKNLPVGELTNRYIRREYTASPELMAMMLDFYAFTEDEEYLQERLLPMCDSLLTFWDQHYENDENGHMKMYPAQALETLQNAENPTPDVAGLHWVLGKLLALPEDKIGPDRRRLWTQLSKKVPPLPMAEAGRKKYVLGAGKDFGGRGNSENPELYAVFPFRLYGVGKPDREVGRLTFDRRRVKGNNGWRQDDTQAAFLGLAKTAANYVAGRAGNKHPGSRFPAFWGPNMDWIPDQDHGGNLMMALQTMILQTDDGKIRLLPAWPKNWDLEFKLHAPQNTTVEGAVRGGKIENLKVTPESRRKDVVTLPPQ